MTAPDRSINWPMLTASFLVAAMLWAVVFNQSSATNTVSLEVRPQGLDESRYSVSNIRRNLLLTFRGDPRILRSVGPDNLFAYVDLSQAQPGRHRYPLRVTPASLGEIATDLPSSIQVELEEVITRRFPIEAEATKKLRTDAYKVEGFQFDPPEAVVRGPKSEVDGIKSVKAIIPLDEIDPERTEPFNATLRAEGGVLEFSRIEPLQVKVSPMIIAAPAERDLLVRPNVRGGAGEGYIAVSYDVKPKLVTARGEAELLASLSQITTEPIDITGLTKSVTRTVALRVPAGILVKPSSVTFTVKVERQSLPNPPQPSSLPDPVTGGTP